MYLEYQFDALIESSRIGIMILRLFVCEDMNVLDELSHQIPYK